MYKKYTIEELEEMTADELQGCMMVCIKYLRVDFDLYLGELNKILRAGAVLNNTGDIHNLSPRHYFLAMRQDFKEYCKNGGYNLSQKKYDLIFSMDPFDANDIDNELRKTAHADDITKQLALNHKVAKDIAPFIQALISKENSTLK